MKLHIILITIILTGCGTQNETAFPAATTNLPKLPLTLDLQSFDLSVQKQFKQRIQYIKLVENSSQDKPKLGWAIGQLAKTYQAYQKTDEARDCYLHAIANDSLNIEWYYLLAHVYKTTGEFEKAVLYFNKVLSIQDFIPAKIWLADVLIQQNKFTLAQEIYEELIISQPKSAISLYNLAFIYREKDQEKQAITLLNKVLELQPKAYQAHYQLAQIYTMIGELTKADFHSQQVADDHNLRISIELDDPLMQDVADLRKGLQSIIKAANKASAQGYYNKAISLLQKARSTNPNRQDIIYNLAVVNVKMKNMAQAKLLLSEIINITEHGPSYALLAKVYKSEGNLNLAIETLLIALKIAPKNTEYHNQMGQTYSAKAKHQKASEYYLNSLSIDPQQESIQLKYIRELLQTANNTEQAIKRLNGRIYPRKFAITQYNLLVRLLLDSSVAEAESWLNKIIHKKNTMTCETMAMLSAFKGQFDQAVIYQNDALTFNPNHDLMGKKRILDRLEAYKKNQLPQQPIWLSNEPLTIHK